MEDGRHVCVCVRVEFRVMRFPLLGSDLNDAIKPYTLYHTYAVKTNNEFVGGGLSDGDPQSPLERCVFVWLCVIKKETPPETSRRVCVIP